MFSDRTATVCIFETSILETSIDSVCLGAIQGQHAFSNHGKSHSVILLSARNVIVFGLTVKRGRLCDIMTCARRVRLVRAGFWFSKKSAQPKNSPDRTGPD